MADYVPLALTDLEDVAAYHTIMNLTATAADSVRIIIDPPNGLNATAARSGAGGAISDLVEPLRSSFLSLSGTDH
jgi:hypothetical protein